MNNEAPDEIYLAVNQAADLGKDEVRFSYSLDSNFPDGRVVTYHRDDKYQKAIEALKYVCKPIEHDDAHLALYTRQDIAVRVLKELGEVE